MASTMSGMCSVALTTRSGRSSRRAAHPQRTPACSLSVYSFERFAARAAALRMILSSTSVMFMT